MNIRNPKSIFAIAAIIVILKFALGGLTINGIKIPEFSGADFAMAMAAVGSIHSLAAHIDNLAQKDIKKDEPTK